MPSKITRQCILLLFAEFFMELSCNKFCRVYKYKNTFNVTHPIVRGCGCLGVCFRLSLDQVRWKTSDTEKGAENAAVNIFRK